MSSANDAVFQRRNKQIQDAIDGQNLKQALQLIEKRMKKGENTPFLKAWKAYILYRHPDDAHRQRGIDETLALCNLEPPIADIDTLDILTETLEKLEVHEGTVRSLWEKAAKAKPQDSELQMRWFINAFESKDWKSAQKAAMSLQINFPKTRKYYFWAIFLSYLVAVDAASSEADRKLFGTLAYRMISKAADSVPSDPKELLSAPRAIQTVEELFLLMKIFESQERHSEVVKILDSENIGLSSRIVQNDWSFIRAKLICLEKAQLWSDGLSYAKSLLAVPSEESERKVLQERDDWAVWNLLITATTKINTPETTTETENTIDDFIEYDPKSRNARLARLELIYWKAQAGSLTTEDLLSAAQEYFDHNKHKLYCFVDLQKPLLTLDKASVAKFVEHTLKDDDADASTAAKGVAIINALKLEYCFQLSDETGASRQKVEGFISRCLKAYRDAERPKQSAESSTIESQPSDDLLVLAAMSLIRFGGAWVNGDQEQIPDTILIRAAGILERLILDSPHNYQALLLLVRIYLRLGAGSLALKTFSRLSVKQLQFETVAHNLFTRLATIHPQSAPPIEGAEYKDFHPQSAFVQALNFYRNADITTVRSWTSGLDHGSYVNVEGSIELQKRLKHSICRRMYALEVRRMQRLVGGDPMGRYDELAADSSNVIDQRAFDAFMNCETPGTTTFEERMRLGPLPREQWVRSARVTDRLFGLLKNLAAQKPTLPEVELPTFEDLVGTDAHCEMTPAEIENAKVHLNLLKLALHLNGSKSVTPEDVDKCLAQTEEWLASKSTEFTSDGGKASSVVSNTAIYLQSESPSAPSWRYFHNTFSVLESLKAISLLASVSSRKTSKSAKIPKHKVEKLSTLAREIHEQIRTSTRALKSRISESGMLSTLVDLVLVGNDGEEEGKQLRAALEATMDMSALELFCGSLMESWEEALDGVLSVRL